MNHLDDELLVLSARGEQLPRAAVAHLDRCPSCRTQQVVWSKLAAAATARPVSTAVPPFDQLVEPVLAARREQMIQVVAPTVARSSWLALAVARWQVRLLPRPLALLSVAGLLVAVAVARAVPSAAWGTQAFASAVALVSLLGAVGVAGGRADPRGELWQVLPVPPAAVFWSRLLVVLSANVLLATVASALLVALGQPIGFTALLSAWLGPALLSSGTALLGTVWRGPWCGALVGLVTWTLGSLSTAPSARVDVGVGALTARLWDTTPATLGLALLVIVVAARLAGSRDLAVRHLA
jgi:hypothetical protein